MSIPTETLDALDFVKWERMPSRLLPNVEQLKPVLHCPGCKRRSPIPGFCTPFACDCGLRVQIDGSLLKVWRDRVAA